VNKAESDLDIGLVVRKDRAPEIFNTDKGSRFTSDDWIKVLDDASTQMAV